MSVKYNIYIGNRCIPYQGVDEVKLFLTSNFNADEASNHINKLLKTNQVGMITNKNKHVIITEVGT